MYCAQCNAYFALYVQKKKCAIYSTAGGKVSCVPRYPTVSHKFPRDILCPVVIRSISENFCDYHGTWLSSRYNHRNFQTWVITTELSGHDVSRGNLWDTVGYRETRGNFTTSSTVCVLHGFLGVSPYSVT